MRAKLRTMTPTGKAPRVDRTGNGRILGASLMSIGPALGHGFEIDGTTIDQVAKLAEGTPGRWTHGNLCADGLGTHLGKWRNVHREGDRAVGDFEFSQLAKSVKPDGLAVDAATYLMDLAEAEPDAAGVSAVIDYEIEEAPPEAEGGEPRRLARVGKVKRADFVQSPAANARGMFSDTPSALAEQATDALEEAAEIHGRERVQAFLNAYLSATTNTPTKRDGMDIEALKKKHEAELAARDTSIAALNATVTELKAADEKRQAAEVETYIASLKKGAEPNAIEEGSLAHVRALLKVGMGDAARTLGSALLKAAAPVKSGEDVSLSGAKDEQVESSNYIAASLRSQGWKVEQDAKGHIVSKTPPQKAGR